MAPPSRSRATTRWVATARPACTTAILKSRFPHEGGSSGGTNPVVLIANSLDTLIPGTNTFFGSTAPPSAANRQMVFAGFDNEDDPTLGGIYLAPLDGTTQPPLDPLVEIGGQVPGENSKAAVQQAGRGRLLRRPLRRLLGRLGDADQDPAPAVPDRRQRGPRGLLQRAASERLYNEGPGAPGHFRPRPPDRADPGGRQDAQRTSTTSSTGTSPAWSPAPANRTRTASWRAGAPRASWRSPVWSTGS